jgi:hypothetical protein
VSKSQQADVWDWSGLRFFGDHLRSESPDEVTYHAWVRWLRDQDMPISGEVDRYYFKSLYFREPNQILFELATDGPGFGVDENISNLGKNLALPPFWKNGELRSRRISSRFEGKLPVSVDEQRRAGCRCNISRTCRHTQIRWLRSSNLP